METSITVMKMKTFSEDVRELGRGSAIDMHLIRWLYGEKNIQFKMQDLSVRAAV